MKRDDNTLLPWQYTILALLWLGILLDGGALWFSFSTSSGSAGDRAAIRPYAVGYLVATVVLTPMLIVSGRRRAATVAQRSGFGGPGATYLFLGCFCLLAAGTVIAGDLFTGVFMGSEMPPWLLAAFLSIAGIVNIAKWKLAQPASRRGQPKTVG